MSTERITEALGGGDEVSPAGLSPGVLATVARIGTTPPGLTHSAVIHWLREQDADGRDRWPREQLGFHGEHDRRAIDQLIPASQHHPSAVVL